jgi:hypothetical protein
VDDAIARYRAASEAKDIDALIATLAPDASVASPISGHMLFRGTADLRVLLAAVYGSLRELHWHSEVGDGRDRVVIGHAKLGPVGLDDAMVFELAPDGHIQQIRPHLRPWLALTLFALVLAPKMIRHPRVLIRALRRS